MEIFVSVTSDVIFSQSIEMIIKRKMFSHMHKNFGKKIPSGPEGSFVLCVIEFIKL